MISRIPASLALVLAGAIAAFIGHQPIALHAGGLGGPSAHDSLHVLAPITHGNLTIFPVVGGADYDTSRFLTLDEGVHAGSVIVAEQGELRGLVRRGGPVSRHSGAEVNQLILVNNSDRPLLLLAGEIVTGGKQDRVIGADRLVPPKSDPIDLSVFCVEPGRWVGQSAQFGSMKSQMAQPSVRSPAMAAKDQHEVWNQVAQAREAMQAKSAVVGGVAAAPSATTCRTMPASCTTATHSSSHRPTSRQKSWAIPNLRRTCRDADLSPGHHLHCRRPSGPRDRPG